MPDFHTRDDMTIDDGSNYDNNPDGDRVGNWMESSKGNKLWPLDPRPEEIDIEEIAASLSKICRYNGHVKKFYSVAEHSVYVSHLVPKEHALTGLLHDATEYLLGDIVRPLKPFVPGYSEHERKLWTAVADRFNLPHEMPDCVKEMDTLILLTERSYLMTDSGHDWGIEGKRPNIIIHGFTPEQAESAFMNRYRELTDGTSN